jgi:hypothetical protein
LVEPQNIEGYVEESQAVYYANFFLRLDISILLNSIRTKACLGKILHAHFQEEAQP